MDSMLQDIRYGTRLLIRNRGFSITAMLTLALVIGANVAILSVINSVLLRPLPFEGAERLVRIFNSYPNAGVERASNSAPDFFDRREGVPAFEEVASFRTRGRTIGVEGAPRRARGMQVTPSFFPLLRAEARLGRCFSEDEGEIGNHNRVILGHSLWQELYAGAPEAVGSDLRVNGVMHRVVGVMPQKFFFINPDIELWTPQAFPASSGRPTTTTAGT